MLGRMTTIVMSCLVAMPAAMAQAQSLSATMNVHVFPRQGQDEVQHIVLVQHAFHLPRCINYILNINYSSLTSGNIYSVFPIHELDDFTICIADRMVIFYSQVLHCIG